jgi:hypothetical protein
MQVISKVAREGPPEHMNYLSRCVREGIHQHACQPRRMRYRVRQAHALCTDERATTSRIQFIIDAFQGQVKELAKHPYGYELGSNVARRFNVTNCKVPRDSAHPRTLYKYAEGVRA